MTPHEKAIAYRRRHGPIYKMTPAQKRRLRKYLKKSQLSAREADAQVWSSLTTTK